MLVQLWGCTGLSLCTTLVGLSSLLPLCCFSDCIPFLPKPNHSPPVFLVFPGDVEAHMPKKVKEALTSWTPPRTGRDRSDSQGAQWPRRTGDAQ
jgi:hypothetical protein